MDTPAWPSTALQRCQPPMELVAVRRPGGSEPSGDGHSKQEQGQTSGGREEGCLGSACGSAAAKWAWHLSPSPVSVLVWARFPHHPCKARSIPAAVLVPCSRYCPLSPKSQSSQNVRATGLWRQPSLGDGLAARGGGEQLIQRGSNPGTTGQTAGPRHLGFRQRAGTPEDAQYVGMPVMRGETKGRSRGKIIILADTINRTSLRCVFFPQGRGTRD